MSANTLTRNIFSDRELPSLVVRFGLFSREQQKQGLSGAWVERSDPEQELVQFIVDHVETVPQLEALLLIWQNQSTPWTAELLASRIYVSAAVGKSILEHFHRDGVLRLDPAAQATYRYEASWDAERQLLPRLADLYRRQLVQVTKLIHSQGSSSVREFARAFQIKKDH